MSEFEKELDNILNLNNSGIVSYKDYTIARANFAKKYDKQLVVVPKFVAEWFEENKHDLEYKVWQYINHWDEQEENEFKAFMDFNVNNPIQTIFKMLDGYTVEKEKLYLLKHIEISSRDTTINCYLTHTFTPPFIGHTNFSKGYDMSDVKECHFTQSEIDDMASGSYERIEVVEDD